MKDNKMQITHNESLSKVDEMFCELKNQKKFACKLFKLSNETQVISWFLKNLLFK